MNSIWQVWKYQARFRPIALLLILTLVIAVISFIFFLASMNYLLFHTSAELISIVVSILICVLGTKSYEYSGDRYLFFLGQSHAYLVILNFFHMITYYGMGVFPGLGPNVPTQFWISFRLLNAISLLIAPYFLRRNYYCRLCISLLYSFYVAVSIITIIGHPLFPDSFILGRGLTTFKIYCEYLIVFILILAIIHVHISREYLNRTMYITTISALGIGILTDFTFTLYTDVYGFFNFLGHMFEIFAIYILYTGIVSQGLKAPYHTIFKKLTDRNEELKLANRYKSDFLASMGHEMRTPLTSILAFSEDMLTEKIGSLNKLQREHLQDISTSGKQLLILINDLLDFSKLESGKMSLALTEVAVDELLYEEANSLRSIAQNKELKFEFKVNTVSKIFADENKLRQVIRNLLSNAIKFSQVGGLISIGLKSSFHLVEGVTLEIQDFGIGIPESDKERVFDHFYQVDHGAAKKYSGTGLGLAVVKKIVDLHQGRVWLESIERMGSTFYVFLPVYPALDEDL